MFDIQGRAAMGGDVPTDEIQLIVTDEVLGRLATRLIQDFSNETGPFHNATAHLFQNAFVPVQNMTAADLVECNFTGYSASANLTFVAGLDDTGDHIAVADAPSAFQCTDPAANQVIHGVYLLDHNATPRLLAAGLIDPPIAPQNGQLIPFTATLQVGNS